MAIAGTTKTDVARRYIDAFNRLDWETYKATLTPDSIHIEPGGMESHGPEATVEGLMIFKTAFPDLEGTILRLVVGEQEVALELVWKGMHTGPLLTPNGPIPATGRPVTVHAMKILAFEGDHIKYSRHYWDMLELLGEIGAVPGMG